MDRRELLKSIVTAALATAAPRLADATGSNRETAALFFVPGYQPQDGRLDGTPLTQHPAFTSNLPRGYDGPVTLIARLDETDRTVRRALMPIRGHHVAVDPRGHQAFFSALDGGQMVRFDPRSLALIDIVKPHAPGFVGGGHAAFTRDGAVIVTTERRSMSRFAGSAVEHRGRVVIRDGDSMKVIEIHESHGIAPHDLTLMEAEGLVAVANYGVTWQADPSLDETRPFRLVEPRLSLIELASGRLVDELHGNAFEIRHVAARDPRHLYAIGADARPQDEVSRLLVKSGEPSAQNTADGIAYLPAPVFAVRRDDGPRQEVPIMAKNPFDFREGQTVVYDPTHDEVIATFASSDTLAVIDAKSFDLKRVITTPGFGLFAPRGIAFHPDGRRYVVSGSWAGLFFIARGSHEVDHAATWPELFFNHSHITAVAAPGS